MVKYHKDVIPLKSDFDHSLMLVAGKSIDTPVVLRPPFILGVLMLARKQLIDVAQSLR